MFLPPIPTTVTVVSGTPQSAVLGSSFESPLTVVVQDLGSTAELRRRIQEGFLPIISKLPGFVEYFWTSAGENEMFFVNVFTDRTGAEESVRAAADYVRNHLTSLLSNPPDVIVGEVVVHHTKSQAEKAA